MDNSKKISVIMGIYNVEKTLPEAIESIINQTYTNWNVIMCDDGSVDNTYDIAMKYRDMYPEKFVVIKNEKNIGLNRTLNRCLSVADGDYIARMDGDDISLPERFEKEIYFLENNKEYSFVSTPMIYFDENGDFMTGRGSGDIQKNSFAVKNPVCHAPCMVRKEAYEAVGGYTETEERLRVEDWDLWIRMYAKGFKGYILEKPYYKMRDDRNAYKRRKFKYRINEAKIVSFAIKKLDIPKRYYIWCLRPIIVGLLPNPVYNYLHSSKNK